MEEGLATHSGIPAWRTPWTEEPGGLQFVRSQRVGHDWRDVAYTGLSEAARSCPTLCDPMDCSLPGSPVHGIFQARVLEWVAISSSKVSSRPRDRTQVSCIAGRHFTVWATREAPNIHTAQAFTLLLLLLHWLCYSLCVDHNKLWNILKELGIPDHLTCFLRNLYTGQEATVRAGHGTTRLAQNWERSTSRLSIQSTSCKMQGWMNHKLELRCWEKYQQPQICRWYHSNGRKVKRN